MYVPFLQNKRRDNALDLAKTDEFKQIIINHPWYRRRRLIVMRPPADHISNERYRMTVLSGLVTATEK